MLLITIPDVETWDSVKEEFVYINGRKLHLEHSLIALSKWEAEWKKPFLYAKDIAPEEMLDYIRCMAMEQDVNPILFNYIPADEMNRIEKYIEDNRSATWFSETDVEGISPKKGEVITSELIYCWMIMLNIPMSCEKWHISRLITLIKVCNIKNSSPKKMSKKEILARNASLNAKRRAALNSKG